MRKMAVQFLVGLVKEKNKYEVLLASLKKTAKILFNSKAAKIFRFRCLIGKFFQVYNMASFQNNFQDYRRLSEQLLESQAAIK
jgi:hypothetical protein